MRKNNLPTKSSPCPPSTTLPSANSSSSVNMSAKIASSATLLNITLISSGVIGGPVVAVGVVALDNVEAAETDDVDPMALGKDTDVSVALVLDSSDGVENQVELEFEDEAEPEDERVDVVLADANDGFEALEDTFPLLLAWDIEFERECGWDIGDGDDVVVVGCGMACRGIGWPRRYVVSKEQNERRKNGKVKKRFNKLYRPDDNEAPSPPP